MWQRIHTHSSLVEEGATMEPAVRHVPWCDMKNGYNILADTCKRIGAASCCRRTMAEDALLHVLVKQTFDQGRLFKNTTLFDQRKLIHRATFVSLQWQKSNGIRPSCIYMNGNLADAFYVILSGRIIITSQEEKKEIRVVKTAGDVVGIISVLGASTCPYHVNDALLEEHSPMPVELLRFSAEDYHELIEKEIFSSQSNYTLEMQKEKKMKKKDKEEESEHKKIFIPRKIGKLAIKFHLLTTTAPFSTCMTWYERYCAACDLKEVSYGKNGEFF